MTHHRDLISSEWFHVVQKGADAQDIFSASSHRTVYEEFLADSFTRFDVDLHAYAWMTNHTHLLTHAPHGGLPEAMHLLGSRYASMYNGWTNRTGPPPLAERQGERRGAHVDDHARGRLSGRHELGTCTTLWIE